MRARAFRSWVGLAVSASACSAPAPHIDAVYVEGSHGARAVFSCRGADPTPLELEPGVVPFGVRPVGVRASVAIGKREGLVACADRGTRGALRLHPMSIRAVTPSLAHEGAPRMIIAVDGQALGPRVARDDDVYLVWRGTMRSATELVRPKAPCPEARWTDERVVVCIDPALVRGRGPARVRVQAAGRLEEAAGTAVDLDRALDPVPSAP